MPRAAVHAQLRGSLRAVVHVVRAAAGVRRVERVGVFVPDPERPGNGACRRGARGAGRAGWCRARGCERLLDLVPALRSPAPGRRVLTPAAAARPRVWPWLVWPGGDRLPGRPRAAGDAASGPPAASSRCTLLRAAGLAGDATASTGWRTSPRSSRSASTQGSTSRPRPSPRLVHPTVVVRGAVAGEPPRGVASPRGRGVTPALRRPGDAPGADPATWRSSSPRGGSARRWARARPR